MKEQRIDTGQVRKVAEGIRSLNRSINNDFQRMIQSLTRLWFEWMSRAGDRAQEAIGQLGRNNEVRSAVLQDYAIVLDQLVTVSYENAEEANIKMADQFE